MNAGTEVLVSHFRVGEWIVKPDEKTIERGSLRQAMEPRAMQVLVALCERAGEVLSAEQLLLECWRGTFYGDNPVHKTIAQLRKLLGDAATAPTYIATIRKHGYQLIAPVTFPEGYRGPASGVATSWNSGSPFVGLRAFDAERSAVFCGRARATSDVVAALARQVQRGLGFVLLLGPSGCGKTSLLQAGVLPLLSRAGGFHGLHAASVARLDPAQAPPGALFDALVLALAQWDYRGERMFPEALRIGLAARLRDDTEAAVAGIEAWLDRRLTAARGSDDPRLLWLLCIDQLEALFADDAARRAERDDVLRVLARLATVPRLALLATCRSDFYPQLSAHPMLRELKTGDGQYDVAPLSRGELAQAIRAPAAAAGLSFESHPQTQVRLDDVLRDAAVQHPQALPLLQYALQALYERRGEGGVLPFAAYEAMGGLEGALANHAEQAFERANPAARACLPEVLRHLVAVAADADTVTGRVVPWSRLESAAARELVSALVDARLLVSQLDGGERHFRLAHEALLMHWPRAHEWIAENRRSLAARARLGLACGRWQQEGRRRDLLLPPGRLLDEADALLERRDIEIGAVEREFVQLSRRRARRQRRLRSAAVAAVVVLAAVAGFAALRAGQAQHAAEQRRAQAEALLEFMLGDLTEKLRPLGRLDLLDSIGAQASAYFAHQDDADPSADALLLRSRALRQLGEIRYARADAEAAGAAFEQAAELARRVATPDRRDGWSDLGHAAFWVGMLRHRERDHERAHAAWMEYLRASQVLVALAPDDPAGWVELSYAYNNLGTLEFSRGAFDAARGHFEQSLQLKQRARSAQPEQTTLAAELADTLSWLASCDEAQGRFDAAASRHGEALGIVSRLRVTAPTEHAWDHREAALRQHLGLLALARGRLDAADAEYARAADLLARLTAAQPDHRAWRRDATFVAMQQAWLLGFRGETARALHRLRETQQVMAALVAEDPDSVEWRRLHAVSRLRQIQMAGVGADADAVPRLSDVVADLLELVEAQPQDRTTRLVLAHALVEHGRHLAPRSVDDARATWERVLDLLQDAPATELRALDPRARALLLLGRSAEAAPLLATLREAGYRDPDFVSYYDAVPAGVFAPATRAADAIQLEAPTSDRAVPGRATTPTDPRNEVHENRE